MCKKIKIEKASVRGGEKNGLHDSNSPRASEIKMKTIFFIGKNVSMTDTKQFKKNK